MKTLTIIILFLSAGARAAELLPVKACVKWSKDIPEAQAAGAGLFESVARVEGKGPMAPLKAGKVPKSITVIVP